MNIEIWSAVEADEAKTRSMVRAAHLVPTNLRWSRFLAAEEGGRVVGIQQVKIHKGGTREVASRAVRPEFRRQDIGTELMHACSPERADRSTRGVTRGGRDTTNGSASAAWSRTSYRRT